MTALLRFSDAVEHQPAIDAWLDERVPELGLTARRWFTYMRRCGDDVRELMHDGFPTVCVGDAPFAYVAVFRAHVNVGFFYGAELPDPAGLLEGTGRRMRHVKLRPDVAIDNEAVSTLIDVAYADIQWRLQVADV